MDRVPSLKRQATSTGCRLLLPLKRTVAGDCVTLQDLFALRSGQHGLLRVADSVSHLKSPSGKDEHAALSHLQVCIGRLHCELQLPKLCSHQRKVGCRVPWRAANSCHLCRAFLKPTA